MVHYRIARLNSCTPISHLKSQNDLYPLERRQQTPYRLDPRFDLGVGRGVDEPQLAIHANPRVTFQETFAHHDCTDYIEK